MEAQDRTKWCPGCERQLPLDAFGLSRARHDGRAGHCRECRTAAGRARRAGKPRVERTPPDPKPCNGCGRVLPLSAFGVDRRQSTGRKSRCRACRQREAREARRAASAAAKARAPGATPHAEDQC